MAFVFFFVFFFVYSAFLRLFFVREREDANSSFISIIRQNIMDVIVNSEQQQQEEHKNVVVNVWTRRGGRVVAQSRRRHRLEMVTVVLF